MTREQLANKYKEQYISLAEEYFETVNKGTPKQERKLRESMPAAGYNARYAAITDAYEAELISNGFPGLSPPIEPPRDLAAELDELRDEIEKLKEKE